MKIKTAELTGPALCYVVTMIEMPYLVWGETIGLHHATHQIVVPKLKAPDCYSPFTGWSMCGPIIEREGISTAPYEITTEGGLSFEGWWARSLHAQLHDNDGMFGPTPLIAAMRCYVASRLGDEVDVPEELELTRIRRAINSRLAEIRLLLLESKEELT